MTSSKTNSSPVKTGTMYEDNNSRQIMKSSSGNDFLVKHKAPISCFQPCTVVLRLRGMCSSHQLALTRHFSCFFFFSLFVMDGVMQCWPVVLLMRATLPGPLPPKRTQQLAQSCTHISLVRSDSHVAVADMIVFLFRIDSLG